MKSKARKPRVSVLDCVEANDLTALRKLVATGVDLLDGMEDTSPLAAAIEKGNTEMVKVLLELGHDPDLGGIVVPVALAAQQGYVEIVELLLQRGANVNQPGEEGETALMWAASAGALDMLKRLMDAGTDIKLKDRGGEDALDYAVGAHQTATVDFLLPHFPKSRQEKIRRQAHLWQERGKRKESQVAARRQEAMNRPKPKITGPPAESLFRLYRSGKTKEFVALLAAGTDVNETNPEGTTILAAVASSSSIYTLLEPLVKAGADPNRGDVFRPLSFAAANGAKFVRLLLEAGAQVNWANADGRTALMSAAAAGDEESLRLLLDAGADPNAEDSAGHTAYWCALDRNNKAAAMLLEPVTRDVGDAQKPWRKNKEGKSRELCLLDAAAGGDVEHVQKLLAEGARVDVANSSGDTPLHLAADQGHVEMIQLLLEAGAPIEAEGGGDYTPLVTAASSGQVEAVRKLLQAGADVQAKEGTILCHACENKDCLTLVELLLQAGAKVNVKGGHRDATPLHVATERDQLEVVRRLLQAGAKTTATDPNGWTPFLNAALRSGVETVRLLIDAGADINAKDNEGRNAYTLASKWGKPEVAEFLKPLLGKA